jgi:hypothetical protein
VQNLTQRDLAKLLGTTKDRLEKLIFEREDYISRRPQEIGGKMRNLAIPVRKLRGIHEKIKFHLNKVKQPPYLYSPRKGRGQRDNASQHISGVQVLKVDIRQFYPNTTQEDIFRWAYHTANMKSDVAGLFARLIAIDGKMPFGSPVSPVLTSLIHRPMFDRIHDFCGSEKLDMSLWVDDLTISGDTVSGRVLNSVRQFIRDGGFDTHKIEFLTTSRPVIITGVPIADEKVLAPYALHMRIQSEYLNLRSAKTDIERAEIIDRILSALGTYKYHLDADTAEGRKTGNQMHALKQRRRKLITDLTTLPSLTSISLPAQASNPADPPWAA